MISTEFQQEILKRLSELSPVYIVGGAIRDAQLGIPAKDVDAVMALSLQEIEKKLTDWGYNPHLIGAHQQTVSLFRGTDRVDIAAFSGEIEANALCRDFTLNAIYQDVRTGEIIDPLNGLQDLRQRRLKGCGCAADRFKEDPLRIMRLIRLAVRYGLSIEPETWLAAVEHVPHLREISAERLTEELGRILLLDKIDEAVGLLDDLGYFQTCIPELARLKGLVQNRYHTKDAWEHTRHVVRNTAPRLDLRLAALFHDIGKWETASRECNVWGTIRLTDHGYEVDGFKLEGKNLERWANKEAEVHGGRLDNYPDTIIVKRVRLARATPRKRLEMVPDGKRHFLQHETESARLVKEILPRFRWSMVLPGGSLGERELEYLVGHHMLGTLTFRSELNGETEQEKFHIKTRRFAWEIGWTGKMFDKQRIENLLDLWRADFLGGKQTASENIGRLDAIQGEIRNATAFLVERARQLDWTHFGEFARGKGLEGEGYGRFKEQVRRQVMMDTKYRLTDPQFLEREYAFYWKPSSVTTLTT
ncbi:MAG TPA: CCA tRNA nucleotidyltransferase [Desulfosporosinus sp.]|nr:CCA tRNA nucleotidyltransferase [Desulfosporosinus sp.]